MNNSGKIELFNLEEDVSEKRDLSAQRPEIVARLRGLFDDWSRQNKPRIRGGGGSEDEGGVRPRRERKKAR